MRYDEAAADLRQHYEATATRGLEEADYRLAHLKAHFAGRRLARLGPADATAYVAKRQAAKASNGTINRELAVLNRMLRLAYENGKLLRLPVIRKLKESAPREGFFEREAFLAVRRKLSEDLQVAVTIAYTYALADAERGSQPGAAPARPGRGYAAPGPRHDEERRRALYLTPEVKGLLGAQLERVEVLQKRLRRIVPYLFPFLRGCRRAGQRRTDFRKTWAAACTAVGVPGMLRHDFRRTAVRNMVNAGVAERVAMKVTGHRTRAVFDRYHIVSPGHLQEAARKLAGTFAGTAEGAAVDSRLVSV